MSSHEEFLELCASATAGELTADERAKLDAHLAECARLSPCDERIRSCCTNRRGWPGAGLLLRRMKPWMVPGPSKMLRKHFSSAWIRNKMIEHRIESTTTLRSTQRVGKRFTYRPSQIRWREIWMPFAAAVLLALALGVAAYRTGVQARHGCRANGPAAGERVREFP